MKNSAYVLIGQEIGERNEAVNKIREQTKKKFGETEEYLFYAYETSVGEIVATLQNGSLFANAKFVVVRECDAIKKKEDVELLCSWIKSNEDETAVLVLVSDETKIEKKIEDSVPATNKKVFWEMFDDRKVPWLKNYFLQNGYKIDDDACDYILELVENNTQALKNECSKFFVLLPKGALVTSSDVEKLLEHNREESPFTLFAAMTQLTENSAARTLEACLEILEKLILTKEEGGVLPLLAFCFRKLSLWHSLKASGETDDFSLRKNGFSSKKMKEQYARAGKIWSVWQTAAIKARIAEIEIEIRSGGSAMIQTLLTRLIIEIVIKKGAAVQEYEN